MTVTDDIAARIASGELQPGARLLAERELARRYGVAYGTIRRAMKELRARGLISSVQGRGTFVARQDGPPPGALSRGGIAAADGQLADHPGPPAARPRRKLKAGNLTVSQRLRPHLPHCSVKRLCWQVPCTVA